MREPLPLAVLGCSALLDAPTTCLRDPSTPLLLWLEGEWAGEFRATHNERPIALELEAHDRDAALLRFDGLPSTGILTVELSDGRQFELRLMPEHALGQLDPATCTHALAPTRRDIICVTDERSTRAFLAIEGEPDYAQARADIEALRSQSLDANARVRATHLQALLEMRLGFLYRSAERFARVAALHRQLGLQTERAAAKTERVVTLARLGRYDEADAQARETRDLLDSVDPQSAAGIRFQLAWAEILRREHDPNPTDSDSLAELSALVAYFESVDDHERAAEAGVNLAIAAMQFGRHQQAEDALAQVDQSLLTLRHRLYYELMRGEVALAQADLELARTWLERAAHSTAFVHDKDFVVRVHDARARLEYARGDLDTAVHEYELAEELVDQMLLEVPVDAGRGALVTSLVPVHLRHIEALLELDRDAAALCVVLGLRTRQLRALARDHREQLADAPERLAEYEAKLEAYHRGRAELEAQLQAELDAPVGTAPERERAREQRERTRAELDALLREALALLEAGTPPMPVCDSARPTEPGRALLTAIPRPMPDGGAPDTWTVLVDHQGRVTRLEVGGANAEHAVQDALAKLDAAGDIAGLRSLTFVPLGALVDVDIHELEIFRRPSAPRVEYGIGFGPPSPSLEVAPGTAVVLTAKLSNLRWAGREAAEVEAALRGASWEVLDDWRSETPGPPPALLHFAGHGYAEGVEGWGTYLEWDQRRLTSAELLSRHAAPAIVILSACEAGASDAATIDGGMNMATAFLLAGARLVIAPSHAVDDSEALDLALALYRDLPELDADLGASVEHLSAALARQHARGEALGWRAWVR